MVWSNLFAQADCVVHNSWIIESSSEVFCKGRYLVKSSLLNNLNKILTDEIKENIILETYDFSALYPSLPQQQLIEGLLFVVYLIFDNAKGLGVPATYIEYCLVSGMEYCFFIGNYIQGDRPPDLHYR